MFGKDRPPTGGKTDPVFRRQTDVLGYHAQLVYALDRHNQAQIRYQYFDPDTTSSFVRASARQLGQAIALRRARKRVDATEETLARFFQLTPDLLAVADQRGYFVRVNPAFEATLGHRTDVVLGAPYLELVHPDDREATREAVSTIAHADLEAHRCRFRCADGSYRTLEWSGLARTDEGVS